MVTEYILAQSVPEALLLLSRHNGNARVIAGGTDLVLQLEASKHSPATLIDVTQIGEMCTIEQMDPFTYIGAAVTHAEIAESPIINKYAKCLALAANEVGSPQIRNAGTIGGNVINAQPAADTALALTALHAEAEIVSNEGSQWLGIPQLYAKPGISVINSTNQVVKRFRFVTPGSNSGTAYRRLGKCKSIALPVLCCAVLLDVVDHVIASASIVLGPVAPCPLHAVEAEAFLQGKSVSESLFVAASEIARKEAKPRDSLLRCSKMYRESLVSVLVESTLQQAFVNATERRS